MQSYILQRSTDGISFVDIQNITPKNTANSNYTAIDANPAFGNNFYRLNMIDFDGTAQQSEVLRLNNDRESGNIKVTPNPILDYVQVSVDGALNPEASVSIVDLTGRIISTTSMSSNTMKINTTNLSSGIYLIKFSDNSSTQVVKIVKE